MKAALYENNAEIHVSINILMPGKPDTILYGWLKKLKISVSKNYIRQQLNSHPDYPSLLSITDTLDELGIDNTAIQIEKEQLPEMPVPFVAHLNSNGGEFVIVENRDNLDEQFPDFFERWGGVAIAVEKSESWQHKLNSEWLQKDKKQHSAVLFTLVLLSVIIFLSGIISFNWVQLGLLLISIAGVFISWMIVSKDLGVENKIADQLCGKTDDCNAVIHSNKTKLPFGIGWSDAGIIYFSFILIISIIASFASTLNSIQPVLFLLATCSLPFTLLSVYYQWRTIKKWCRLCLLTVALLWIQFAILFVRVILESSPGNELKTISLNSTALILFVLFIATATWVWLKPLLKKSKKLETENFTGKRFKNNPALFMALLEKQRKVDTTPFENDLQLGNAEAPLQIMVACNPYCSPCAKAHEVLQELVERNDIGLTIRFTIRTGNLEDKKLLAVEYMLALCKVKDELYKRKLLHDWYQWMDEKFKVNYPATKTDDINYPLELLDEWSKKSKEEFTPTVFINGFELPKQYLINDLYGLVRNMKEQIEIKQTELYKTARMDINSFVATKGKEPGT